jgi:quercetin dioxygenase-like cupin family protein/DNA-binding XRE family transcriptional regulator
MARREPAESSPGPAAGATEPALSFDGDSDGADLSKVIGYHVRAFRKELGLSLRGLSERSGLSIGFLSQLERGMSSISLTTLRDLATVLGHSITEFFDESPIVNRRGGDEPAGRAEVISTVRPSRHARQSVERYFTLTRSTGEHSSEYISGQRTYRLLSKRAPDLVLEPMLVSIAPGGSVGELETHGGEEFAYVLRGELCYAVEGVEHRLYPGDSLHLLSAIPHRLRNDTDEVTVVVSVVTPRLF